MLRQLQLLGMVDQVQAQRFASRGIVRPTGDLDQATATVLGAVTRLRIAQVLATFVAALNVGRPPDFAHPPQLARLVTGLGDEGGNALASDNLVLLHRRIEGRCKNAGFCAGVREDLQRLLLGNGHRFLQAEKSPHMAGCKSQVRTLYARRL